MEADISVCGVWSEAFMFIIMQYFCVYNKDTFYTSILFSVLSWRRTLWLHCFQGPTRGRWSSNIFPSNCLCCGLYSQQWLRSQRSQTSESFVILWCANLKWVSGTPGFIWICSAGLMPIHDSVLTETHRQKLSIFIILLTQNSYKCMCDKVKSGSTRSAGLNSVKSS